MTFSAPGTRRPYASDGPTDTLTAMDALVAIIGLLAVVGLWVLPSYWVALYAQNTKGQNFAVFFLLGLITSFAIALIVALIVPGSERRPTPMGALRELDADAHPFDRLEQLSAMHDRGVITDDEYVEQKARLLR